MHRQRTFRAVQAALFKTLPRIAGADHHMQPYGGRAQAAAQRIKRFTRHAGRVQIAFERQDDCSYRIAA
jgi:hypothetical protein